MSRTITPFKFPNQPTERGPAFDPNVDLTVYQLSSNMRVVGLARKSRNGTTFYVVDSEQLGLRGGAPLGYARVIRTTKDGKVTARLTSGGGLITFHTRNKIVWPVTPSGNPSGLKQAKWKPARKAKKTVRRSK